MPILMNVCQTTAPSAWRTWVDFIMKQKKILGLRKAALIHNNGATASATSGFMLPAREVQNLRYYFDNDNQQNSITLGGKTFIVKHSNQRQLVAFNGNKYYIISRSKSMYIVAVCDRRSTCDDAAGFVRKMNAKLMEKDY